jgi:pimeloyl-ACP methyl ester carboxylesterase
VTNPTSGVRLFVQLFYPPDWSGEPLPTLVLVPGGTAPGDLEKGQRLAADGFTVVIFDPDGRGASLGAEDLNGAIHQDGLAAVIRAAAALPGVDAAQIGLVSYSYGITMASGVLARYPDLPIRFLIDWEGPADRYDTTLDCTISSRQQVWPDCDDDEAWAQREALTFIAQVRIPYQRIQSEEDHVQLDVSHAVNMVNAAIAGGVPWVRLNDYPPDQTYDPAAPPDMLPERMDRNLEMLIAQYAGELFARP